MTHTGGCSERYTELCALFTAGALSDEEAAELREHLPRCPSCRTTLAEYEAFIAAGLSQVAAELTDPDELAASVPAWSRSQVKEQLLAAAERQAASPVPTGSTGARVPAFSRRFSERPRRRIVWATGLAAALLLTATVSYQIGKTRRSSGQTIASGASRLDTARPPVSDKDASVVTAPTKNVPDTAELASLRAERSALQAELDKTNASIQQYAGRAENDQKQIAELEATATSLAETVRHLRDEDGGKAQALETASADRADLKRQLDGTVTLLATTKQDLDKARQDRERALRQTAGLETEVTTLNARLHVADESSTQQQQFLASDRDIRDLMGARQLYIADVFDVNQNGKKSPAFGRVFFTKGKSLIFYAFDLDREPGLREAKASQAKTFQAWGRSDAEHANPVSLGIFYEDNEANRRWVLKTDNPDVLAQISAVFVTVEPQGGSKAPSGKPFLFAYLHSLPPNHP